MWSTAYKLFTNNKLIIIVACLVIVAYLMPYYILGENTHIRVHDNLDSNIVWYKILAESGMIFSPPDAVLPNVINGLPRSALPSAFDWVVWLYVLFEPFTAYTINQTVMRFVAFFGMYILLKRNVLRGETSAVISAGVALTFALLPFWPSGSLSFAGMPLALHIFLTIRKQGKAAPKWYWVILGLLPFFSNFILTFIFFLTAIGFIWLVDWIRTKQFNAPLFFSIAGMTCIYLLKNYMLLYSMFISSGFTSQREELNLGHKNLAETWELFLKNFLEGHTHALDLHKTIILPVIIIAIVMAIFRKVNVRLLLGLLALNIVCSIFYAFWYWEGMRLLKDNFMLFNTFNFSRFQFLRPLLWYLSFALALHIIWKEFKLGKFIVVIFLVLQCSILFPLTEEMKYTEVGTPTFEGFYSTELFQEVADYIGEDKKDYRVVSIGMHPAVAQYNSFYTLDTYNNTFPLSYKKEFREIIAPELDKSDQLKSYFDTWGSRLYMYVSELGKHYLFSKNSDRTIEHLDINTEALKDMGGKYVFSALPIENANETGLTFERTFERNGSPWRIYLYKVKLHSEGLY